MDLPEIRPLTDAKRSLTRWMLEQGVYLAAWKCTALEEERRPFCRCHPICLVATKTDGHSSREAFDMEFRWMLPRMRKPLPAS